MRGVKEGGRGEGDRRTTNVIICGGAPQGRQAEAAVARVSGGIGVMAPHPHPLGEEILQNSSAVLLR